MLSTYLRTAQFVELAIYSTAAYLLGLSWPQALLEVVVAFLGVRLLFVAAAFALAWLHRSPRAPEHRIGTASTLAMLAREYLSLLTFSVVHVPWERALLRADPPAQPGQGTPIVLVHGYFANRGYFRPMVRHLEQAGFGPVFVPNLRSYHATIERFEAELGACLERVAEATGKRCIVVAHSMGGLGIRAHLARHGTRHVERVVTIATPHHGTALARHAISPNARQMCPGSAFLRELERIEGAQGPGIPLLSIYSTHDNLVAPQATSRLPWARNVAVPGRGHIETVHAPEVVALVLAELGG